MKGEFSETAKNLEIQITKIQEANQKLDLMHLDLDKNIKLEETRLERALEPFLQEKAAIQTRLRSKMTSLFQGCTSFIKDYETCSRSDPNTAISTLRNQVYQEENLLTLRHKETKFEYEETLVIEQAERLSTYVHENRNMLRLLENITREIESKLYELERSNEQKKLWQNLTCLMKEQNRLVCEQEDLKLEIADTEQRIQRIIEQHKSEKRSNDIAIEPLAEMRKNSSETFETKYISAWVSDLPTPLKGLPPKSSMSKSRLIKKYIENPKEDCEKTISEEQTVFNRTAAEGDTVMTKSKVLLANNQDENPVSFEFLGKLGQRITNN